MCIHLHNIASTLTSPGVLRNFHNNNNNNNNNKAEGLPLVFTRL